MLGFKIKRGVEASVERIFKSTGSEFDKLTFNWSGQTAAVSFSKTGGVVTARIIFPNLDDNKQISDSVHHDLVGYAVHELGHIWFTDNDPWDAARQTHGAFVGSLINGLEDPRIERFVIESGHVPNARVLFNHVVNSVLLERVCRARRFQEHSIHVGNRGTAFKRIQHSLPIRSARQPVA